MTTNDIVIHEDQPAPVVTYAGSEMIAATARALTDAHTIGSALCRTSFVPKHFQGKPDDAAAAILYGSTINMDPVTALQNVYVIGGKPALYARTMVAIVMSKGHEIWTEDESEGAVTVAGRRKGSDVVERVTWTSEMAQRAGYTTNAKYKSDPRSMLYARASGDVARRIAPDALLGMAHNVEELRLEPDHAPTVKPQGMGALRAAVAPAQPAPDPQADEVTGEVLEEPATRSQLNAMFAAFGDLPYDMPDGRTPEGREARLAYCSRIVGREVASSKDLTRDEASAVLDALRADAQQPGDPFAALPMEEDQ